jgi:hypothetical protein
MLPLASYLPNPTTPSHTNRSPPDSSNREKNRNPNPRLQASSAWAGGRASRARAQAAKACATSRACREWQAGRVKLRKR